MNSASANVDAKWIRKVPKDREPVTEDTKYFKICSAFNLETLEKAINYKPTEEDVFIATYPKNGTTWMQQMVYLIQHDAIPPENFDKLYENSVFLEQKGPEGIEEMKRPGSIKIHLPAEMAPYSDHAKYIVVVRNPKDVAVSFYHHHVGFDEFYHFKGDFNDFFNLFLGGQVEFGDYYHFINSWLTKKNNANVLFLSYEWIKRNPEAAVRKVAYFIDEKYGRKVDEDKEYLKGILHHSSVSEMKKRYRTTLESGSSKEFSLVRKGQVNEWKNMLSEEQSKLISQRFKEESEKNPLLMTLWDDYSWLDDHDVQTKAS